MRRSQIAGQSCLQKTSHYSVWKVHYWLLVPTRNFTTVQTGGAIKLEGLTEVYRLHTHTSLDCANEGCYLKCYMSHA